MNDEGTISTEARIAPEALPDACKVILDSYQPRLLTMLGTDERAARGIFRLRMILALGEGDLLELCCDLAPEAPSYPSITPVLPAAAWYEREIHDLLGLVPDGHPDLRPLVQHGVWPAGYYPLRKDAMPWEAPDAAHSVPAQDRAGLEDVRQPPSPDCGRPDISWASAMPPATAGTRPRARTRPTLTLGPLPSGIGEPVLLHAATAGDMLTALEARLFYAHRGAEKLCEDRSPDRALEIVERICGACSVAHALACCGALEAIAGVVPPFQAQIWRAILLEMETLRAHIGDIGALAAVADRPQIERRCAALRERLLALNRAFTGMRHPRGVIVPGGLRRDLPSEAPGSISRTLADIHAAWQKTTERLTGDKPLRRRLRGLGVLQGKTVEALGVVGPVAQASGMVRDCRLEQPHDAYAAFPPAPSTRVEGDAEARMLVRLHNIGDSFRLLAAMLESLPGGPVLTPLGSLPAGAQGLGRAESARGENLCWLAIGSGGVIERCHLRAASYCTWPAVPIAAGGTSLEDLPLLIASFGLCVACVDR